MFSVYFGEKREQNDVRIRITNRANLNQKRKIKIINNDGFPKKKTATTTIGTRSRRTILHILILTRLIMSINERESMVPGPVSYSCPSPAKIVRKKKR